MASINTVMKQILSEREREMLTHSHYIPDGLRWWCIDVVTSNYPSQKQIETAKAILNMTASNRHKFYIVDDELQPKPRSETIRIRKFHK